MVLISPLSILLSRLNLLSSFNDDFLIVSMMCFKIILMYLMCFALFLITGI